MQQTGLIDALPIRGVLQENSDDCVRACVASLLGLPLVDVPRFCPESWGDELDEWLKTRGWGFINVAFTGEQKDGVPRGFTIGAIPSPSYPEGWMHSVICLDGRIVWDPKSGPQPGTERASEYTVFYPPPGRDPSREGRRMTKIIDFFRFFNRVQQSPDEPWKPRPDVLRYYAQDIERYGTPMDSDLAPYLRKTAAYLEGSQ